MHTGGENMVKEYTDRKGQTVKVHITGSLGSWEDRKPKYIVPWNIIGTINLGENRWGNIGSEIYAGFDGDFGGSAVIFWESMSGSQMEDLICRIYLRAVIFMDEQPSEIDSEEPDLPYLQAGVCAIVHQYASQYGNSSHFSERNLNFDADYKPYIAAILNKTGIPEWGYDEDLF